MRHIYLVLILALVGMALHTPEADPGVVFEIEAIDHEQSPPKVESIEMAVEGKSLKMSIAPGTRGSQGTAIYRGDRREMIVVDHDDMSYMVMDAETLKEMAAQVGSAMKQIEEALKNVPEAQREAVEKMMKERMSKSGGQTRSSIEIRKTGERATHQGYPCVKYEVLRDGRKIREVWTTDWDNIEGGAEVAASFKDLVDFFASFAASMPQDGPFGGVMGRQQPFDEMNFDNGFPVVSRVFDEAGALEEESTLRSATRRTLDPAEFEPPAGYKRRSMGPN